MTRLIAMLALAASVLAACGRDSSAGTSPAVESTAPSTAGALSETTTPPMLGNPLPLTDLDGWLQTDITSLEDLRGQVVIVQFWTFGCINCKRTLPYLQDIYEEHRQAGLEIVGVHSPEFTYEEDPDAIQEAADELGVTWPIALDTRQRNFFSWQGSRGYWPRTYVLDRQGLIRFDHIGEGKYEELEQTVVALLAE